jgi:hypothetical protein
MGQEQSVSAQNKETSETEIAELNQRWYEIGPSDESYSILPGPPGPDLLTADDWISAYNFIIDYPYPPYLLQNPTIDQNHNSLKYHKYGITKLWRSGVLTSLRIPNPDQPTAGSPPSVINNYYKLMQNKVNALQRYDHQFPIQVEFKIPVDDYDAVETILHYSYNMYRLNPKQSGKRMYYIYPDKHFPIWSQMSLEDIYETYFHYVEKYGYTQRGYSATAQDFFEPNHDRIDYLQSLWDNGTISEIEIEELNALKKARDLHVVYEIFMFVLPIAIGGIMVIVRGGTAALFEGLESIIISESTQNIASNLISNGARSLLKKLVKKFLPKLMKKGFQKLKDIIPNRFKDFFTKPTGWWKKLLDKLKTFYEKGSVWIESVSGTKGFQLTEDTINKGFSEFLEWCIDEGFDAIWPEEELEDQEHENEINYSEMSDSEWNAFQEEYITNSSGSAEQVIEELWMSGVFIDNETANMIREIIEQSNQEFINEQNAIRQLTNQHGEENINWFLYNNYVTPYLNELNLTEGYTPEYAYYMYTEMEDKLNNRLEQIEEYVRGRYGKEEDEFPEEIFFEALEEVIDWAQSQENLDLISEQIVYRIFQQKVNNQDITTPSLGEAVKPGLADLYEEEDWAELVDIFRDDETGVLDEENFKDQFPYQFKDYQQWMTDQAEEGNPLFQNGNNPFVNPYPISNPSGNPTNENGNVNGNTGLTNNNLQNLGAGSNISGGATGGGKMPVININIDTSGDDSYNTNN